MNLSLFLANKLYGSDDKSHKVSNPAIRIALAGIAIGLAVMIISVAVVLGFKHTIRDKVTGFGSHITVSNFLSMHGYEQKPVVMDDSMMLKISKIDGVKKVQRYAIAQGILKTDSDFLGVALKGVAEEYDTTFLSQCLLEGEIPHFSADKASNNILISKYIANKLSVKNGEKIFAYFIKNGDVRMRRFVVCGIYETNMSHFDKTICLTDIKTTISLNGYEPGQVDGAEIIVKDYSKVNEVADRFVAKINRTIDKYNETYSSATIEELYPNIFSWLDLLDLNVWIILGLMLAVAGFTMISGLLIIILERTNTIGLLKALGMRNSGIRHTFMWFAVFIIGKGIVIGDVIAFAIIYIQKFTGFVSLDPSTYYIDVVPLEINWLLIIALNIATLLVSCMILILPSMLVSHIHPAKVMRYE